MDRKGYIGGNLPARFQHIRSQLLKAAPRFQAVMPSDMRSADHVERLIRVSLTAVVQQPELFQCSDESILLAVMDCAHLGLMPGGALDQAHLVKFGKTCQMIPDYRGIQELARRTGLIQDCYAREVREGDELTYRQGTDPYLEHKRALKGEPGDVYAFYAIAHPTDPAQPAVFDIMRKDEVDAIRDRALERTGAKGPWVTDPVAMGRKTAVKQLAKWLPQDPRLHGAVKLDNLASSGQPAHLKDIDPDQFGEDEQALEEQVREAVKPKTRKTDALEDRLTDEPEEPEEQEPATECPDCGTDIGDAKVCPECGWDRNGPPPPAGVPADPPDPEPSEGGEQIVQSTDEQVAVDEETGQEQGQG